jgi:hypothetical protein
VLRQQLIGDTIPIISTTNLAFLNPRLNNVIRLNKAYFQEAYARNSLRGPTRRYVNSGANIINAASD